MKPDGNISIVSCLEMFLLPILCSLFCSLQCSNCKTKLVQCWNWRCSLFSFFCLMSHSLFIVLRALSWIEYILQLSCRSENLFATVKCSALHCDKYCIRHRQQRCWYSISNLVLFRVLFVSEVIYCVSSGTLTFSARKAENRLRLPLANCCKFP